MSKPNTKRASISKKNSITQNQIIPEIIHNKFLNESNTIVNDIIEKIISLVISSNFTNKIEKKLSKTCYKFIKETLNLYLSSNFITHDKDETYQNSFLHLKSGIIPEIEPISQKNDFSVLQSYSINNNNTELSSNVNLEESFYFNNHYHGENDWDLMDEPSSNKFDRYAGTLVKFKEIEKQNLFKYNQNGEVLEEVDEESEKNSINNDINNNDKNHYIQSKNEIKKFNILGDNKNKKKNLIDLMNQFPYQDLDDNNDIYKEPKEINYAQLRKELEEKQNEQFEEKKIIKKAKLEVENKLRAEAERNRQYIGKKITVDPKGEIVFIKGIKIEKLNKEFLLLKTGTKLIRDEEKENKKKIKKKKINKDATINDDKANNIPKDADKDNNDKNKDKDNNDDKNQKIKATKILPKLRNKFRTSIKEVEEDNNKSRLLKRIEEGPIMLSGSNFEIMNMEVGVSIKENEKFKSGGKDFYHKYNKYSMANYNKKLKETTEMNSFLKTHIENENPMIKSDINYMGNFTDTYNTSVGFINNSNFNQQMQNSKNYQFNTLSNFGNSSIKKKELNSSLSPHLKLSLGAGTLLGSMEKLNLITERKKRQAKKTENIFKKNFVNYASAKELILPKLEEINKFTSEISTSSNWMKKNGINNTIGSPFRNPGKPGFKEISREMGIRGKILRNRMKNNIKSPDTNQALETVDFFKRKNS